MGRVKPTTYEARGIVIQPSANPLLKEQMMANRLTMAEIDKNPYTPHNRTLQPRIAGLLGINRETVGKYVTRAKAQNQPNVPSSSNGSPLNGLRSECEPFRGLILPKIEQVFLAKRIHQDLADDHGEPSRQIIA
jgi:hypothetical protein